MGLTFKPYGVASASRNHESGEPTDWTWEGGFDLYKNFTPNFVGAFSYNMDFAETEVDERRVNLTRFPLYFPEKRTFFLEGSEIFNFGTTSADGGFAPFFSRRIGLYEGRQVPVVFGTKAFGKLGNSNIQVLDVRTDALNGLPAENFLAARVSQNILAESKVGLIFTDGSPTGAKNSLAGFDLVYQTSRFMKDKNFLADGWFVYNWNENPAGRHEGFGLKLDYPNDLWDIVTTFNSYGDALEPGIGFLPRRGVQVFTLGAGYQPRPEKGLVGRIVRQFFYELRFSFTWDLAGVLETRIGKSPTASSCPRAPTRSRTTASSSRPRPTGPGPQTWNGSSGIFIPGIMTISRPGSSSSSRATRPWGSTPISSADVSPRGTSRRTSTSSKPTSISRPGWGF